MNKFIRPLIVAVSFAIAGYMIYDALDPQYRFGFGTTEISSDPVDAMLSTTITPDTTRITMPADSDSATASTVYSEKMISSSPEREPTMNDFKVFNYKALIFSLAVFAGLFALTFNQHPPVREA
jgi:hypothetical protein